MKPEFIFILASLATYRLALMFSKETGPGRIFQMIRELAPKGSATREGLECPFCMSIWFSCFITIYLAYLGDLKAIIAPLWWLACSAVAVCLNQLFTKGPA